MRARYLRPADGPVPLRQTSHTFARERRVARAATLEPVSPAASLDGLTPTGDHRPRRPDRRPGGARIGAHADRASTGAHGRTRDRVGRGL